VLLFDATHFRDFLHSDFFKILATAFVTAVIAEPVNEKAEAQSSVS